MPGFLYHAGASAQCPHGGQIQVIPIVPRVFVCGFPVATMTDPTIVAGCIIPKPCVKAQWIVPASRILVSGRPALVQSSIGICQSPDQSPQGPAIISATQVRVFGI
jgi:hypothetical protein